jgi:hypothetical protein
MPALYTISEALTFSAALERLKHGEKITRDDWDNPHYYGVLRDGLVMLHKPEGFFAWTISEGDLLAADWRVID